MKQVTEVLQALWRSRTVRDKFLVTIGLVAFFRLLAHVPLVGVDLDQLRALFASNQLFGILNIFSGGTLAQFSVASVGISPYITASILVQISGLLLPRIKEMQRESEASRAQLQQWTRFLTVPIAVVQSLSLLLLLRSQGLLTTADPIVLSSMVLALVTGALIVMWLGELVTKHGIGNGISLIIFVGILSQIPTALAQTWSLRASLNTSVLLALSVGLVAVLFSVVYMTKAIRRVPIQQAKRQRGSSVYGAALSHLPLKVNHFGVMPIIFALPLLSLPSTLAPLLLSLQLPSGVATVVRSMQIVLAPGALWYNILYAVFIFAFSFFSIYVYFQPKEFAEDLKKSGTYIPGIRPGKATAEHLQKILLRLAALAGIYLMIVALLPILAQQSTGLTTLTVGGTGLLIVVSVILEALQSIQAQLVNDQYEKYR